MQLPWLLPISMNLLPWAGFSSAQFRAMLMIHSVVAFITLLVRRVFVHNAPAELVLNADEDDVDDADAERLNKADEFIDKTSKFLLKIYYGFGLQCCVALLLMSMLIHADVMSVCYSILVAIAVMTPRRSLAKGTIEIIP